MEEDKIEQNEDINMLVDVEPEEVKVINSEDKIKVIIEVKQAKNNLFRYEQTNLNEETGESFTTIQLMKGSEFYMTHYANLKANLAQSRDQIKKLEKMVKIYEQAELKSRPFIERAKELCAKESEKNIKAKEKAIEEYKQNKKEKANSLG